MATGRPPYKPTAAQRRAVAIGAGGGMSHEEMSIALGISRPTLEKYFEAELSIGALQKRMEILKAMHTSARKGNVAAQKAYLATTPTPAAPPAAKPVAAAKPEKVIPLGKKEQAQADAVTAAEGTGWETLLSPTGPVQ